MERERNTPDTIELYRRFEDSQNKELRYGSPFAVLAIGNIVVGILVASGNDTIKDAYGDMRVWIPQAVGGVVTLPGILKASVSQREKTEQIAVKIAKSEGRQVDTNNFREVEKERSRAGETLSIAHTISPSTIESAHFDAIRALAAPINGFFRHILGASRELEEEVDEAGYLWMINKNVESMVRTSGFHFKDKNTRNEVLSTAFEIAKRKWQKIADNPKQPEDRRKYANLVISQINLATRDRQSDKSEPQDTSSLSVIFPD